MKLEKITLCGNDETLADLYGLHGELALYDYADDASAVWKAGDDAAREFGVPVETSTSYADWHGGRFYRDFEGRYIGRGVAIDYDGKPNAKRLAKIADAIETAMHDGAARQIANRD